MDDTHPSTFGPQPSALPNGLDRVLVAGVYDNAFTACKQEGLRLVHQGVDDQLPQDVGLVCAEDMLGVGTAFEDLEALGFRSLLELLSHPRQQGLPATHHEEE